MMTWLEFMQRYDPEINAEEAEFVLWEMTSFPFGRYKTILKQIRSAIRIKKNRIRVCDICGTKVPYHKKGCPNTANNGR